MPSDNLSRVYYGLMAIFVLAAVMFGFFDQQTVVQPEYATPTYYESAESTLESAGNSSPTQSEVFAQMRKAHPEEVNGFQAMYMNAMMEYRYATVYHRTE